ncbi:hypothetical protein SAMN06264364_101126 [Quadrisphaera granulorum]|uniref:DUF917 domain-containing protein n=1 Tax=Quadrisphaera granulorum TaxID=317664 RepID=A0A316AEW4_9ACTN|nr:DUF917 domain-containing protein [Quadrisphaera granulorum]PWJ56151.1 hypothetical protein BXY45_101126 [Quadrisphaera granulorum]SZE94785.1 hypothetical protein SAMN06264364_101126 [Quadrisphaera granulorum]
MSWLLDESHLADLSRGATLLGTGGGGDPYIGRLLVAEAIKEHGPITVLDPDEVDDDLFVIPTAMMGAPTVMVEKIPRGTEPVLALRTLEAHLGRTAQATMPIECGGLNSMIPLLVAARAGLPIIDADGMGRAFPELQMETFSVYGVHASPMVVAGDRHETVIVDTGDDDVRMERLSRACAIQFGGAALIAEYAMTGADVKRVAIPRTLSLGIGAGRAIREAREEHRDPFAALAEFFAGTIYQNVRPLFRGKVSDVERRTVGGFTRGGCTVAGFDGGELELRFQNEHLLALRDGEPVCVVPDLICVLDDTSAEPITTESLRYGQRVVVLGISTPPIMRTPEALAVFGPAAFGLEQPFVPVEELVSERFSEPVAV